MKCPECGSDLDERPRQSGPVYFVDLHCHWCGWVRYDEEGGI